MPRILDDLGNEFLIILLVLSLTFLKLPYLLEGTSYEARRASKEQTKMPRFMFEGPRPCTILCFALIHYA